MSSRIFLSAIPISILFAGLVPHAAALSASGRYQAEQLARTRAGTEAPDWIVNNFAYPESSVVLEDIGDGKQALRLGNPNGREGGRYTVTLRYPWSAEPGFRHEVSVRFSADYGKPYNAMAGFGVQGPGTRFSVNLANNLCRHGQPWGDRTEVPDMTEAVKMALDGKWSANELHTYTVKWTTAEDGGDTDFELYVDGTFLQRMPGEHAPPDRKPTLFISFEYGVGAGLIEFVEWKMTPSDEIVRRLTEEAGTWLLCARGPGFSTMRINSVLDLVPEQRVTRLEFKWMKDNYRLSEYPGEYLVPLYGGYLFAGVPYQAIGPRLTAFVEQGVRDGANLLVMGGPYAFGKGGYGDTPFEALLPVRSIEPFEVRMFGEPERLEPTQASRESLAMDWANPPTLHYYHDLELAEDAEVLITAGTEPILVRRSLGEGHVYAFLGFSAGRDPKGYTSHPDWPGLLAGIVGSQVVSR